MTRGFRYFSRSRRRLPSAKCHDTNAGLTLAPRASRGGRPPPAGPRPPPPPPRSRGRAPPRGSPPPPPPARPPAPAGAATTAQVDAGTLRITGDLAADKIALANGLTPGSLAVDVGEDGTTDFSF